MHTPGHARTHAHSTPNKENSALHVLLRLPTFPQTFQESRGSSQARHVLPLIISLTSKVRHETLDTSKLFW